MASIINASNSSGLTLTSDLSGVLQLQQNGVALPALSVAPAFSAYQNSAQSGVTNYTPTKVTLDTEIFDTNNNFASSRFTPTVAGYYQFNYTIQISYNNTSAYVTSQLYKNGTQIAQGTTGTGNPGTYAISSGSALAYMNGTTDYVEMYVYGAPNTGSTFTLTAGAASTFFNGFLARGA